MTSTVASDSHETKWGCAGFTRANTGLKRDVAVFLGRIPIPLGLERGKRGDQLLAGMPRLDDFVDEAALRREAERRVQE